MQNEFTAVIERDGKWFIAYCPEVPGANGQGSTKEKAKTSLVEPIALILEDRRTGGLRGTTPMKVATGKIVGGKVVIEGEPLAEGAVVMVVAREEDETFEVSTEEEKALLAAIAQAERGEVISWAELRERLRP